MPVYVFRCSSGHVFERVAPMREAPLQNRCPTCQRVAHRDFRAEMAQVTPDIAPFFSEARGVFEESERLPGETYDGNNNVLVKSRAHMRALDRRLGLVPRR